MNLSQRQLRMFVTTAAFANITRASEALHTTQPALTRSLRDFEAQVGATLFRRTTRSLALTPEGERFLPRAQQLLADMERAVREVHETSQGLAGSVSIAVGVAFAAVALPAVLSTFAKAHPAVQVRLVTASSGGITRMTAAREVDFGIGSPVGETGALRCESLLAAPLGLLAHPRHFTLPARMSAKALPQLPLLKDAADSSIMQLLRSHGSELVARMHRGVEVSDLAVQLALAKAGVGVAVVSALGASHPEAARLSFSPLQPRIERQIFLMTAQGGRLSAAAEALARTLREALAHARLHPLVRLQP